MSIPGPKPKPAELAELQGNPGHRPIVKTPDTAPVVDPSAPDWIASNPDALAIWQAYKPHLRVMGYVRNTDRLALARLCDHTARWLKLRKKVDARGESYTTESRHGTMERINPDFNVMMRLEDKMLTLEDRFGLSPATRQQVLRAMREGDGSATAAPELFTSQPEASQPRAPEAPSSPIGMMAPKAPSSLN